jgi:transposase
VLKRLKTGCQWRELPVKDLFGRNTMSWQSVYYYYSKWCRDGSWYDMFTVMMDSNRRLLDMSSVELAGSHTPAKRGCEAVGYQRRKKSKTTNMLLLTDKQGIPIGCSEPISDEHNDLFDVEKHASKILGCLEDANISCDGLFLNSEGIVENIDNNKRNKKDLDADSYFVDAELYKERLAIERTNAWLGGFKSLIIRHETKAVNWLSLHHLAFVTTIMRMKYGNA